MDKTQQEPQPISVELLREQYVENALGPRGILNDIALTAAEPGDEHDPGRRLELGPDEAASIILPSRRPEVPATERWQLIEDAKAVVKEGLAVKEDEVFTLAEQLSMRLEESLPPREIARIDGDNAVWVAEGGANKTARFRMALIVEAMRKIYGKDADLSQYTVYQLGSHRPIPVEKEGKPNPEHGVARSIAPDHITEQSTALTEFKLNVVTNVQSGYESENVVMIHDLPEGVAEAYEMTQPGMPRIVALRPAVDPTVRGYGSLTDGFNAVAAMNAMYSDGVEGKQLVISTNGQFRPKDELQASRWIARNGVDMLPPVAIGDEPGFKVAHNGETLETGQRAAIVYAHEIVRLRQLQQKELGTAA